MTSHFFFFLSSQKRHHHMNPTSLNLIPELSWWNVSTNITGIVLFLWFLYSSVLLFDLWNVISLSDWINLTLDDRTSQKMLWLSEGGAKVSRMSEEVCPVLDRPERYEYSPQVCKWVSESVSTLFLFCHAIYKNQFLNSSCQSFI